MNIAVISFDQDLINSISKKLSGYEVKGYTDSLSLLREMSIFNPEIIVYDASGGELALNALEFFLSRDKVKDKTVKVLISKENPIDESSISQFSRLDFYDKDSELDKLIEDVSVLSGNELSKKTHDKMDNQPSTIDSFEESYQPPVDMEALIGDTSQSEGSEEIDLTMEGENLDDVNELLKEMENISPETSSVSNDFSSKSSVKDKKIKANISSINSQSENGDEPQNENLKITIELSPTEVRKTVLKIAVDKLIEEIKNDVDIQKIKDDIQKDFFDRLEKELKDSIDDIKESIKNRLFESIESELKDKVKESIKEDVTKITTQLVKEKLEQVFGTQK